MYLLGATWGPAIAGGAFWRLLFPIMLHANHLHIFFNLFFQLRIAPGLERIFGGRRFMQMYIFCGIFGNIFSGIFSNPARLAIGASTSGFGLIGVWVAEILISWKWIKPEARERLGLWFSSMAVSMALMTVVAPQLDVLGHLGGVLGGVLAAFMVSNVPQRLKPEWYDQAKSGSGVPYVPEAAFSEGPKIGLLL
jgi:membrane associated rhomboid family serine protease